MNVNQILSSVQEAKDQKAQQERPHRQVSWSVATYLIAVVVEGRIEIVTTRETLAYPSHTAVQVWKSDHRPFQFHRFSLGKLLPDGRFVPSVSPRVDQMRSGQPQVDRGHWEAIRELLEAAENWQVEDAAHQVDEYAARTTGPSAPQPKRTGKTERSKLKG